MKILIGTLSQTLFEDFLKKSLIFSCLEKTSKSFRGGIKAFVIVDDDENETV